MSEIIVGDARVMFGDCRDVLKTLADCSVDSVVTDPPYELGFMGKKWDSTGIAYDVSVWEECLRVLKPGGHVLAFGGSRTWHRMAVAIEDAGFEIRDSIAWMYGSGFPKSLDVSKAIDKGMGKNRERQLEFTAWMRASGLTATICDNLLKEAGHISATSNHSIHYFNEGQPVIATADTFNLLRPLLPPVPENIERLVAERTGIEWTEYKKRVVTGTKITGAAMSGKPSGEDLGTGGTGFGSGTNEVSITSAHTPEAQQWEGWGTALKPAFEPIVVGRKPFAKGSTVAANVLLHGVGGLNIDASRIGTTVETWPSSRTWTSKEMSRPGGSKADDAVVQKTGNVPQGRWPANVILDDYSAGLLDEQSGENPSRFFYCAKASKRDRNEGLEDMEIVEGKRTHSGGKDTRGRPVPQNRNIHPTVKPTALMRYLIKLVTPAGGTVLDPFTGSGSTGKAALLDGYKFVGAELTEEYLPIIEGRLRWAYEQEADDKTLF